MDHDIYSEDYIRGILTDHTVFAMVGASANKIRPSYFAMKYLLQKGFRVIPVNPGLAGGKLLGQKAYADLDDIPEPVEIVEIFRNSEAAGPLTDQAIRIGAKVVWMQLGVRNDKGRETGREGRPQGRHEPMPEDRVRPALRRGELGRHQFRTDICAEADHVGQGVSEPDAKAAVTLAAAGQLTHPTKALKLAAGRYMLGDGRRPTAGNEPVGQRPKA